MIVIIFPLWRNYGRSVGGRRLAIQSGRRAKDPPKHNWKYPNRVRHRCPLKGPNPIRATCGGRSPAWPRGPVDPARGKPVGRKEVPSGKRSDPIGGDEVEIPNECTTNVLAGTKRGGRHGVGGECSLHPHTVDPLSLSISSPVLFHNRCGAR